MYIFYIFSIYLSITVDNFIIHWRRTSPDIVLVILYQNSHFFAKNGML
ncbi:hypothetical protein MITSMUL_03929 [Mitsuokella multacida DSM 20544]|uniref:Uncharacterized protein n=1 Tax=Mitsuokella multacida DSM 20544 TaxID=500635 RepID=C9KL39_9FIRM|nr:hypothetical protein MITSMUL_03929 [Mitsuokella multacida DSM 20544]